MSTVQLDFSAKERFELFYIDEKGQRNKEVFVIHRAPLSTHERFMAFVIEHFGGDFPLWLSPVQAVVLPIGENQEKYAKDIDRAVFPGLQGGPHENAIAAKAVAFGEALKPEFQDYAKQIIYLRGWRRPKHWQRSSG